MKKKIKVSLNRQVLHAYESDKEVFQFDCATGDKDHPTGLGVFRISRKHATYTSKKYGVPMDFAMFFTSDGKAIHKSHVVGPISLLKFVGLDYFGSHGCVRLAGDDAKRLFDWAPIGTVVEISQS